MTTLTSGQRGAQTRASNQHTNFFDERDEFMVRYIHEHVYPMLLDKEPNCQTHAWLRDWVVDISSQGRFFQRKKFEKGCATYQISQFVRDKQELLDLMKHVGNKTRVDKNGMTVPVDGSKPKTGDVKWKYVSKNNKTFLFKCVLYHKNKHNMTSFSDALADVLKWANDCKFISYRYKSYNEWYSSLYVNFMDDDELEEIFSQLAANTPRVKKLHSLYISQEPLEKAAYFHNLMVLYDDLVMSGHMPLTKQVDGLHFLVIDFFKKNGYAINVEKCVVTKESLDDTVSDNEEDEDEDGFFGEMPPMSPIPSSLDPVLEAENDDLLSGTEESVHKEIQVPSPTDDVELVLADIGSIFGETNMDYQQEVDVSIPEPSNPDDLCVSDFPDCADFDGEVSGFLDDIFTTHEAPVTQYVPEKRPREEDLYTYLPAEKRQR